MKYFEYETGFGGIGDTQRADIVLNANAVNEQSKAFFKEICEKNSIPYIIISGCIFSKLPYSGGVNDISVTAGYIYNLVLDSIIEVEAQNVTGTGDEWTIFYLQDVVKNDNADGIRTYLSGASVNCWKEEKYILKGQASGSPNGNTLAQFNNRIQDVLREYIEGKFVNYDSLINSPDYTLGSGYIELKKSKDTVSIKFSAKTVLDDTGQFNSRVFTLPEAMRPVRDTVTNYACWYTNVLSGNFAGVAMIKSTGEVTVPIASSDTQVYCNFSFIL